MWGVYSEIARSYPKIPLAEERVLIAKAQKGSKKSRDEIVLRHIGFVIFRLRMKLIPRYLRSCGPDFLSASIPILCQKVRTYNLAYKDSNGRPKPVKFASYIWKSVDGFIIKSINQETARRESPLDESEYIQYTNIVSPMEVVWSNI
jgi:hypothetical protein